MKNIRSRFQRLLRTKNLEFFQIQFPEEERFAYLLYYDNGNLSESIDILLITHFELNDNFYQDIVDFNDDMFGMKPKRHYYMSEIVYVEREFKFDFPNDMTAICLFIQNILMKYGVQVQFDDIFNSSFDYLSQDL